MQKTRFAEEKMAMILQEVGRTSVALVAKKYDVSELSLYNWHKRFSCLVMSDVKRLCQLEQENRRLVKKVVSNS